MEGGRISEGPASPEASNPAPDVGSSRRRTAAVGASPRAPEPPTRELASGCWVLLEGRPALKDGASRSIRSTVSCDSLTTELPSPTPAPPISVLDELGWLDVATTWSSTVSGGIGTIGLAGGAFTGRGGAFTGTCFGELDNAPAEGGGEGDHPGIVPRAFPGAFTGRVEDSTGRLPADSPWGLSPVRASP